MKRPNWPRLWHGFVKSNYITALWNWFMMLAGKASEPVLFASVLYSGYQLVPGVPQPTPGLNAIAFVTQQAALDIGGLGLIKLTKDEDPGKFKFARRIGVALIALMVVNMIVATSGKVFPIPSAIMQFIEGILLIVRSVMAVLFGHAIHTLRDNKPEQDIDTDIDQIVTEAVQSEAQHLRTVYELRISELEQSLVGIRNEIIASQESTPEETLEPVIVDNIVDIPRPKITAKLIDITEHSSRPRTRRERTTDELLSSDKKRTQSSDSEKRKRVERLLRRNPGISSTLLAEKAGVSRSYAGQIKRDSVESK
jgi:hypothetical protein